MPLSAIDVALIANALAGDLTEVHDLLLAGANVNAKDTVTGATALFVASSIGHVEIVHLLLQHDMVDVNLQHNNGTTALYVASKYGHVEVVRELLKHDVRLQCADNGDTALHAASKNGSWEVVRELLQHSKVDVNAQNKHGETALFQASQQGYQKVVKELLEHDNVEVNLQCNTGATALHIASENGHAEVVRALLRNSKVNENLQDNGRLTAWDVAWSHLKIAVLKVFRDCSMGSEVVNVNRQSLAKVMTTRKADPVELSFQYITNYIALHKLGSAAFGDVIVAEDSNLPEPKKFAVKMIKFFRSSDGTNEDNLKNFEKELWTLKRLHHPNILDLYGYTVKFRAAEQFLVYEYASNGSLDDFLNDEGKRADLPADRRLSIMYQVADAVHFLHDGEKGVQVFHRDIKSANICLTEDFTPKLIDCGLVKFEEDEHSATEEDELDEADVITFGTPGYMCPEYAWNKAHHIKCDYVPAYDVYSIGIVMAELILGRLNDGKPTNVLQTYVLNHQAPFVDGWKRLINAADGQADWNADALQLVCKTAMGCVTPSSEQRLSTDKLIALLEHASNIQAGKSDDEPKVAIAELDAILLNIGKWISKPCFFCNSGFAVAECSKGHALCALSLDKAVANAPPSTGVDFQLPCLSEGCSSDFHDRYPYKHIHDHVWRYHLLKNDERVANVRRLHNASQQGDVELVRELLQHNKVDVNAKRDTDGATALYIASENGRVETVSLLLQQNDVDVNAQRDSDGATALYIASYRDHAEVVKELLKESKIEVNAKDAVTGATALYAASFEGHVNVVRELLQHHDVDVNLQQKNGVTALYIASYRDHAEVVKELLKESKIEVNAKDAVTGATALYAASFEGHVNVVHQLLQHDDVDVNLQQNDGITALYVASQNGHVNVVKELLERNNVEVNFQRTDDGGTALYIASQHGRVNVVRQLLQQDGVEVNAQNNNGETALYIASENGHLEVVRELLQNSKVKTTLKDNDGRTAREVAMRNVERAFKDYEEALVEVKKDRKSLDRVMTDPNAEPTELSYHYIKRCIKVPKLGSGAFGDVLLAEDCDLSGPKTFVVKMIKLSERSDGPKHAVLKSFQTELSTLKIFRQDNIIRLYGYNLNVDHERQFLVFEYAANGSLNRFLEDEGMRARLRAGKRLSIMHDVARAVRFLHDGAKGVQVFHRDIKSANICLTEDLTPKLIDCGLAKFVENMPNAFASETIVQSGSTQGPALGTHGYMCPEYTWNKSQHIKCEYKTAYDVYSFGVVMAELILGRLNDGKPTNVLHTYVLNGETATTVGGWEQLEKDADNQAGWNAEALQLVCKTAFGCLIRISHGRLSTSVLVELLQHASNLQDGKIGDEPKDAKKELNAILIKERRDFCKYCAETVEPRKAVVTCSEGHALCATCIEQAMEKPGARNGDRQLPCLIDGCSGLPFQDSDLVRRVDHSTFQYFFTHPLIETVASKVDGVQQGVDEINVVVKHLSSVMDSHSPGLALLIANAERLKLCPALVFITPIAVDSPVSCLSRMKNLKTCLKNVKEEKYNVTFCCEHSGEPGHDPFEISVDRKWIVTALPWLQSIINVVAVLDQSKISSAVVKELPLPVHSKEIKALIGKLGNERKHGQMQTFEGDALQAIADMANKEENKKKWCGKMVAVVDTEGRTMWVQKQFATSYGASASVD